MSTVLKFPSSTIPVADPAEDGYVLTNIAGELGWLEPTGGEGTGGTSSSYTHVITASEATAKLIVLPLDIKVDNFIDLDILGGSSPALGQDFDFNYTNNWLIWTGLGLEGLLQEGDTLVLTYLS